MLPFASTGFAATPSHRLYAGAPATKPPSLIEGALPPPLQEPVAPSDRDQGVEATVQVADQQKSQTPTGTGEHAIWASPKRPAANCSPVLLRNLRDHELAHHLSKQHDDPVLKEVAGRLYRLLDQIESSHRCGAQCVECGARIHQPA